jgi:hypothetical protein
MVHQANNDFYAPCLWLNDLADRFPIGHGHATEAQPSIGLKRPEGCVMAVPRDQSMIGRMSSLSIGTDVMWL